MIDILIPTYNRSKKLRDCIDSIMKSSYTDIRIIVMPDLRRMWPVALMNEAFGMSTADVVFPISDDIVFKKDTIRNGYHSLKVMYEDDDGVVGIKQEGLDNDTGLLMIGRTFLERFPEKKAFCPSYKALYCDTEIGNFAKSLGLFVFCEDAVAIHKHPAIDPKYMDETHRVCRQHLAEDIKTFERRQLDELTWGESFTL